MRLAPLLLLALVGTAAAARELQGMETAAAMANGAAGVAGAAVGAAGDVAGAMGDYIHESIAGLKNIHEAKVGASQSAGGVASRRGLEVLAAPAPAPCMLPACMSPARSLPLLPLLSPSPSSRCPACVTLWMPSCLPRARWVGGAEGCSAMVAAKLLRTACACSALGLALRAGLAAHLPSLPFTTLPPAPLLPSLAPRCLATATRLA